MEETIVSGLSYGVLCIILSFAVLVEHRLVTDGRTNRQTYDGKYYTGIASRGYKSFEKANIDILNYILVIKVQI